MKALVKTKNDFYIDVEDYQQRIDVLKKLGIDTSNMIKTPHNDVAKIVFVNKNGTTNILDVEQKQLGDFGNVEWKYINSYSHSDFMEAYIPTQPEILKSLALLTDALLSDKKVTYRSISSRECITVTGFTVDHYINDPDRLTLKGYTKDNEESSFTYDIHITLPYIRIHEFVEKEHTIV